MESWGTAVFLLLLALAMVGFGVIVSRMVKAIDPNNAAELASDDARFSQARIYVNEQDDRNEKTWGWRLSTLENRVRELEERARSLESRSIDAEVRSLQGQCARAADKARTALQTANEALVVAHRTDRAVQDVIESATLRAAVALHANAIMNDSTPEDDPSGEYTDVDGRILCKHGNPIQFHYEGGCDT